MGYLEYLLYFRARVVWDGRNLPSYLGPSVLELLSLFVLLLVNSITLFALSILLLRSLWSLGANITTIEGWEIERHSALLRRARVLGGYLDGPDGLRVKIFKQEFPYDIGIYQNIKQGMGGGPLSWLWPLAASPSNDSGLEFEVNGFEDPSVVWPPPDPDRIPRRLRPVNPQDAFTHGHYPTSKEEQIDSFRRRQERDIARIRVPHSQVQRRRPFHERYSHAEELDAVERGTESDGRRSSEGEEGWRNSEGDRLQDFGVDEDADFYDEDNVPLAELLRRRQSKGN
ncbi:MAG: palmitoyltransferase pfa4 [Lasallia pustulata]|uniref:Palmitoyltransferase pfa4 n=1 Tax=Lasallia pustulata TaxID=136370 RepID=A0A5M8Q2K6_9LECA|nr:MAG: palmitoyltransferase pfa4 [Lasallia pustulata]KAA6415640.1 MAG: palmitoyltransferase pfa4 [Lasallia pustulata]